jgi:succinate-semialdehyde dehydrogenase / glutarate-semialdehyde dehydrogenase
LTLTTSTGSSVLPDLHDDLHIGGRWLPGAAGDRFPVIDPSDGSQITTFAAATEQDCRDAV